MADRAASQSGGERPGAEEERTVVVPPRHSPDDEERTVVVDRPPLFNDDERTIVAPPPSAPPPGTGPQAGAKTSGDPARPSAPAAPYRGSVNQPSTSAVAGAPPARPPAGPAPQGGGSGLPSSYPPAAQRHPPQPAAGLQPSFAGPPGGGGPPYPYGYPAPGPYGAPAHRLAGPTGRRRPSRSRILVWGGLALAAVVGGTALILGLSRPDLLSTKKLDIQAAQAEIQHVLTDDITGYGDKNVADVKCNDGANVTVKQGSSFTCQVSVDGTARRVTVTFLDNNGNFEVGRPD